MRKLTELSCKAPNYSSFRELDKMGVPDYRWIKKEGEPGKVIHIVGLGDVGQNVAIGLAMAGGETVREIGIFDLNEKMCQRMEHEIGQIYDSSEAHNIPTCRILTQEQLFDCDLFLFCATRSVPSLTSEVKDVRMAQYEANKGIIAIYAKMAAEKDYGGLFVVVSDPVDLLCGVVLRTSAETEHPLHPEQIVGCGLGVMNARARYYAKRNERLSSYLTEGRAFGPHGQDLVIANSIEHYDEALSKELTDITVGANLRVRELGFKPYIAPAMSSAVWSILALINGRWHESAGYLNGVYFGARNRIKDNHREWENIDLPENLYDRIETSYRHLEAVIWN